MPLHLLTKQLPSQFVLRVEASLIVNKVSWVQGRVATFVGLPISVTYNCQI